MVSEAQIEAGAEIINSHVGDFDWADTHPHSSGNFLKAAKECYLAMRALDKPTEADVKRVKNALVREAQTIIEEQGSNADIFWHDERFARAAIAALQNGV